MDNENNTPHHEENLVDAAFLGQPAPSTSSYPSSTPSEPFSATYTSSFPPASSFAPPASSPQQPYPNFQEFAPPTYSPPPPASFSAPPPPGGYPPHPSVYPPTYAQPGYPQGAPYGAPHTQDAVLVGVQHHHEHHHAQYDHSPIEAPFSAQLRHLPKHFLRALLPRLDNYRELVRHATWAMTLFLLAFEIVWNMIFASITGAIAKSELEKMPTHSYMSSESPISAPTIGYLILAAILGALILFFFVNGTFHLVAMCFGGGRTTGKSSSRMFLELCYASLLFLIPLDIIRILTLIPVLGVIINFIIVVFTVVLFVISLRAVYDITVCQAIGIIILYVILLAVVISVLMFTVGMTLVGISQYLSV